MALILTYEHSSLDGSQMGILSQMDIRNTPASTPPEPRSYGIPSPFLHHAVSCECLRFVTHFRKCLDYTKIRIRISSSVYCPMLLKIIITCQHSLKRFSSKAHKIHAPFCVVCNHKRQWECVFISVRPLKPFHTAPSCHPI